VLPRAAVLEAARIDLGYRTVFFAPAQPPLRELPVEPGGGRRLTLSSAYLQVEEHWPLIEARQRALRASDPEASIELPPALPQERRWALFRTRAGVGQLLLDPRHARLLALLETCTLEDALGRLEAECAPHERAALPALVARFMQQSLTLGFFRSPANAATRSGTCSP
jgi:hypothetical protein